MTFQFVAGLYRELKDDAGVLLIEPGAECLLQQGEFIVDVVGDVIEDSTVGVITAECE